MQCKEKGYNIMEVNFKNVTFKSGAGFGGCVGIALIMVIGSLVGMEPDTMIEIIATAKGQGITP